MLSTTKTPPVLHHTNEYSVPRAIRSASTPSGSFPIVEHAGASSLDYDLAPAPAPGSATQSLHESQSVSQLYPRSSILINAHKRPYSGVIYANPSLTAPVVTHIPAVPSRKEREKEKERAREREKERERERERAKSKDEEKIWGIPKKALLLGLGDLNFNAQMAMMAGWGHGSGGASILPSTAITTVDRKRIRSSDLIRPSSSSSSSSRKSFRDSDSEAEDIHLKPSQRTSRSAIDSAHHKSTTKLDGLVSSSPIDERMDPEELAALNAIINTRRSMAAAQALVSGSISITPRPLRASTSFSSSANDLSRPPLDEKRFESQDSVSSISSVGQSSASLGSTGLPTSALDNASQTPTLHSATPPSCLPTLHPADAKSPRIRFAPLPTPTSAPPTMQSLNGSAILDDSEQSDSSESEFDSDDESKSMKGKWYLMGMPSAYFKPEYYTKKGSKRRNTKSGSGTADGDDRSEDSHTFRRKSTGSISDVNTTEPPRRPVSEQDEEQRGRGAASASASKPKRKSSHSRRRSRSRSGAVSSGDEDERARRRELIRLARPGGTGMVTLPDGTKIRARRVNDLPTQDEPEFIEWGFAGLAREASRRSLGGSGPPSLATTPNSSDYRGLSAYMEGGDDDDDDDDGSGMAWVRRRRREREAKARIEREQAQKAAVEPTVQVDTPSQVSTAHPVVSTEPASDDSIASTNGSAAAAAAAVAPKLTTSAPATTATPIQADVSAPTSEIGLAQIDEPMPSSSEAAAEPVAVSPSQAEKQNAKRQSLLSTIDTSPYFNNPFASGDAMVASPAADEPSASLEASMLSEVSPGDPTMGGSQILGRANRAVASESSVAGDSTPRQNTGLGLTASKAEEIRRRHEDEVAALGAEVLAQTRRNNQRRKASSTSRVVTSPQLGSDELAAEQDPSSPTKNSNRVSQAAVTSSSAASSSVALAKASSRETGSEKKSISRAVGSIMRKATTDSEKTVRHPAAPTLLKQEVTFPHELDATELKQHNGASLAVASAHHKHTMNASLARTASPESTLSRQSSAVSGYSASAASKSASSLHNTSSSHAASPMSNKRISLDPSVSTPAPSPWLPRRPDARGVAVVPLPQLGVRPERPREGRVWQSDDSDASDADKDDAKRHAKEADEEEEEGSDLDAEELLEEERKTAMQKKRATTRAAGQEVVHARLGKKASARALSDLTASYDDMVLASTSSSSASTRRRTGRPARRNSMDMRISSNASRSPAAPRKAPPKLVRSRRSVQSIRSAEDEDEDVDEKDLWPAASATSKSGTPRPRHILVNLPGGPGIWDSKTGGGRNAVAAINSVAAARAKAIKKRARDRHGSFELPPDWDDEMMDYGWPRSLKGSLY